MCGIFGSISNNKVNVVKLCSLVKYSRQRGIDSSGIAIFKNDEYQIMKANYDIKKLVSNASWKNSSVALGHSRLVTNGLTDNQPVFRDDMFLIHNGIIVNEENIWNTTNLERLYEIDSEAIIALAIEYLSTNNKIDDLSKHILTRVEGTVSAALSIPTLGKLVLFSNNGSLFYGEINNEKYFASEKFPLTQIGCKNIFQIWQDGLILDIPKSNKISVVNHEDSISKKRINLIPKLKDMSLDKNILEFKTPSLKRCSKCILPETMPFIQFDENGVCNYCINYHLRNIPKPKDEIFSLVAPYRRDEGTECIVPLSGGRDSMYSLHLVVNELKMRPITYTYDWGMVTDLARRNISRISSKLGVENIIVAADITKKRNNIKLNLKAWLKNPHLGMISILTAGDKHFFNHIETVKKQTGISLNLWGINPLEITHFKSGFLGVKPDFEEKKVYVSKFGKQMEYQKLRFYEMMKNPRYFNRSIWDTISGEYYRSIHKKSDYFHVYDYWRWDEKLIDNTLINDYGFEMAPDTNTTWRIGDGTAAFYNYIYYTVAGFTEHDTFRSNQIREGQLSRDTALEIVLEENKPRYQNIRWYLDALGLDFEDTVNIINNIPKLYE